MSDSLCVPFVLCLPLQELQLTPDPGMFHVLRVSIRDEEEEEHQAGDDADESAGARPGRGAHVARAALSYLHHQVEPGTSCPLTMTHAAVPVLRQAPALRDWCDRVAACRYDEADIAPAGKTGLVISVSRRPVAENGRKCRPSSTSLQRLGFSHSGLRLRTTGMLRVEYRPVGSHSSVPP